MDEWKRAYDEIAQRSRPAERFYCLSRSVSAPSLHTAEEESIAGRRQDFYLMCGTFLPKPKHRRTSGDEDCPQKAPRQGLACAMMPTYLLQECSAAPTHSIRCAV